MEGKAPDEMVFEVVKSALGDGTAARLGRLAFPSRNAIPTPNFLPVASRGAVPHLTWDNVFKNGLLGGSYMALEDCEFVAEGDARAPC